MTEQDILDRGIELIAISFVDGAGVTRAKSITAARAEATARHGVGASKSLSNFTGEDILATATGYEATGDVRLLPDLDRLAGGIDGWGWAPGDLVDQEGEPWDVCTRSFLKRQVARVAEAGYELRMTYEHEWYAESRGRPARARHARLQPQRDVPGGLLYARGGGTAGRVRPHGRADPPRVLAGADGGVGGDG